MIFIGYFDDPLSDRPAFDPGLDINCPVCLEKLAAPMRTHSLMLNGAHRSYFYRTHRDCDPSPHEGYWIEEATGL